MHTIASKIPNLMEQDNEGVDEKDGVLDYDFEGGRAKWRRIELLYQCHLPTYEVVISTICKYICLRLRNVFFSVLEWYRYTNSL